MTTIRRATRLGEFVVADAPPIAVTPTADTAPADTAPVDTAPVDIAPSVSATIIRT